MLSFLSDLKEDQITLVTVDILIWRLRGVHCVTLILPTHSFVALPSWVFFNFYPFQINILIITALKKLLHLIAPLVMPAWLARHYHFVAPHVLSRQGETRWHACLTSAGVVGRGPHLVVPSTPARQAWRARMASATEQNKFAAPAPFRPSLLSSLL
jgi:hypothetical protein